MPDSVVSAKPVADPLSFTVTDVTGTRSLDIENYDGHLKVAAAADAVATMLELPRNTPFGLREDKTARTLQDDEALGAQISPGSSLTLIPKSHLG
jgi:hypothetical protein